MSRTRPTPSRLATWALLASVAGCTTPHPTRPAAASPPSSPRAVASAEPRRPAETAPRVTADSLAQAMREPGWPEGTDAELFELGAWKVLEVRFENGPARTDGMPSGSRYIALFDAKGRLLEKFAIRLSQGGADLLEPLRRDIDGDGHEDLLLYYGAFDGWLPAETGFVVISAAGGFWPFPFKLDLPGNRSVKGDGCWARIDQRWVFLATWSVDPGLRVSATAVTLQGFEPLSVYAWKLGQNSHPTALEERIPKAHRAAEPRSELGPPDCSRSEHTFLVAPSQPGWALLGGLSLSAASVGANWPADVPKPSTRSVFEIVPLEVRTLAP